ncbi:MAG: class I SAM-dependent methyltransferase, partial [Cyclobacteriaceae bacterium]|nr:class I SAM-dependent methyltransferase [Cyclobacteriaceae bacterium]
MPPPETIYANVNRAFTTQSHHYDEDDRDNIILQQWRSHVYRHVEQYLRPKARILELNAGTGIDAVYFALKGNAVLATDLSDGMVGKISEKIADRPELS